VSEVAAIILAAGQGTRFGSEPKLLASLEGVPLVRRVAEAALGAAVRPVIVVTGHRAAEVAAVLAGFDVRLVHNPLHGNGLSTSLQTGFAALPREPRAAIVLLADMPLITAPLIDGLVTAWREQGRPTALVPTVAGRRGNPVVLSRALEPEIGSLAGDIGAAALLRRRAGVVEWPVDGPGILQDVDTSEALSALER
jgi:molybdenum cofactor cytidylyltransferase